MWTVSERVFHHADRDGHGLSITELAGAARVSRAYLYSPHDLVAARELREKTAGRPTGDADSPPRATTASRVARIETLRARSRKLLEENRQLRRRLEAADGELRERGDRRDSGFVP